MRSALFGDFTKRGVVESYRRFGTIYLSRRQGPVENGNDVFSRIVGNKLPSYGSVSQPPGRGPVPGPNINYTGPREVLLQFVILVWIRKTN